MAATITVTATVQDPSGTALAGNSFLRFRLRNFAGFVPQISGTSILPEIQVDATPTNGLISQALWPNNALTPSTTFYTVELWNQGRVTSSGNYIFNVSTSLNTAVQVNTPPVPAGFSLVLENNGALNSSQSTLNTESSDSSIIITDRGSGTIDFQSAGGHNSATQILWSFDSMRSYGNSFTTSANFGYDASTNNGICALKLVLPISVTISKVSMGMASLNGGTVGFAIYDSTGTTKLLEASSFSGSTSGKQTATLGSPVTLAAGEYWAASGATVANNTSAAALALPNSGGAVGTWVNVYSSLVVKAANPISGGVMPASLGALTTFTPSTNSVPGFLLLG